MFTGFSVVLGRPTCEEFQTPMTCQSACCRGLAPCSPSSLRLPAPSPRPAPRRPLLRLMRHRPLALPPLPALLALLTLPALIAATAAAAPAEAQSLYGSHESLVRQNLVAQQHDYPY